MKVTPLVPVFQPTVKKDTPKEKETETEKPDTPDECPEGYSLENQVKYWKNYTTRCFNEVIKIKREKVFWIQHKKDSVVEKDALLDQRRKQEVEITALVKEITALVKENAALDVKLTKLQCKLDSQAEKTDETEGDSKWKRGKWSDGNSKWCDGKNHAIERWSWDNSARESHFTVCGWLCVLVVLPWQ